MTFDDAFQVLMVHEGGYVNHAQDPGGQTNKGITLKTARLHGYMGDMRDLPDAVAKSIYKSQYWDKAGCETLPFRLRYSVFDAAVNSGPEQSVKWLQRAVRAKEDGIVGIKTTSAAYTCNRDEVVIKMLAYRLKFLQGLPTWSAFSRGWVSRIASIMEM